MDFEFSESQQVIATSAAEVLESAEPESAWKALAKAGLLALTLPARLGGDDLGVLDAAVLLTEVGRRAASVPVLATIMLGALPVTRWGGGELQDRVLAGVGSGEVILTAGVREQSVPLGWQTPAVRTALPAGPATVASLDSDGTGTVSGTKLGVPYAGEATWILAPAAVAPGRRVVVVVSREATGVTMVQTPTSGVAPEYTVRLDGAPIAGVLDDDRAVDDLYRLALAGVAALGDGLVAGALDLTAGYIARREQFGKPLATFQAVAQQIADVYVASRTLHLAALSACWRLDQGLDATEDLDIAAYWLATEAPSALRTCHHLHGGIGLDVEYPLPRYSGALNDLVRLIGGADYRLEVLAGEPRC